MTAECTTELNRRDKAPHVMIPLPFHGAAAINLLSSRPRTRKGVAGGDTCSELCNVALQETYMPHTALPQVYSHVHVPRRVTLQLASWYSQSRDSIVGSPWSCGQRKVPST
eukprot:COSAG02_NODE_3347_length_6896_cov_2.201854_7_plen_111_part_00